jgi:hypothetical protein
MGTTYEKKMTIKTGWKWIIMMSSLCVFSLFKNTNKQKPKKEKISLKDHIYSPKIRI